MTAVFTGRGYECHFLTPVSTGRGHGTGRVPVHTGSVYGALLHCETCVMSGCLLSSRPIMTVDRQLAVRGAQTDMRLARLAPVDRHGRSRTAPNSLDSALTLRSALAFVF